MKSTIHLVAAARPNFMKIAPLYHALKEEEWAVPLIVHTGQHYDVNMSDAFFRDLRLPAPDIHLGVGSGSHADQSGQVMIAYEKILLEKRPDLVVVVGDVNSTMACTIAATKISYESSNNATISNTVTTRDTPCRQRPIVAHLEAGLRSFDRTMPEEINRLVTDVLADFLWTPSLDADANLLKEGIASHKIIRVGNIMIDSLEMLRDKIMREAVYGELGLAPHEYGVVTLHRPSNVDNPEVLSTICALLCKIARKIKLIFPVHPRTRKNLENTGLISSLANNKNIVLVEPQSYIRFMNLVFNCRLAITDSGGIQEETTYLGIPCLTIRPNTERPITITNGTNRLCTLRDIENSVDEALSAKVGTKTVPDLWDGNTASRVVKSIRWMLERGI